jgi:hypothetical protein
MLDQRAQLGRKIAPARIVEIKAGKVGTIVFQDRYEFAPGRDCPRRALRDRAAGRCRCQRDRRPTDSKRLSRERWEPGFTAVNPAESFLAALAACMIMGIER